MSLWIQVLNPVDEGIGSSGEFVYFASKSNGRIFRINVGKDSEAFTHVGEVGGYTRLVAGADFVAGIAPNTTNLARYDVNAGGPWTLVNSYATAAVASGSTLYAIQGGTGDLLRFLGFHSEGGTMFEKVGGPGHMFIGYSGFVVGISPNKDSIWRYDGHSWTKIGGAVTNLFSSANDLYAIEANTGNVLRYLGSPGQWASIGGPGRQFVAGSDFVAGTSQDGSEVWRWNGGSWARLGSTFSQVWYRAYNGYMGCSGAAVKQLCACGNQLYAVLFNGRLCKWLPKM